MKKTLAIAVAGVMGVVGYAEAAPQTPGQGQTPAPRSIEEIRANALAEMRVGNLVEVRSKRARSRGWRGGRSFRGRSWRGGRNWSGRRYGYRRNYGGRRYYHRGRRGYGGAVAAGVAGFALGAIAAGAARSSGGARTKQWCANRYKSYDWRSGTYMTYSGVRRACP